VIDEPIAGLHYPKDVADLRRWFRTDDACLSYLEWLRWGDSFDCPLCGYDDYWNVANGRRKCKSCQKIISVTSGTVFDKTRIPMTVWFEAAWYFSVNKKGVSATDLLNWLPINSYQTAWTMLGKFRAAISSAPKEPLKGKVELDEWMQGGVRKGVYGRGVGKNIVIGAIEKGRGGRLRFQVIPNTKTEALRDFAKASIRPYSKVFTDDWRPYRKALDGYEHGAFNESKSDREAHELLPDIHRVFSLCDRWLLGTHQGGVKKEHLQSYLDEYVFRFNRRNAKSRGLLFLRLLELCIASDKVTYRDLVKVGAKRRNNSKPPVFHRRPGSLDVDILYKPWLKADQEF